MKIKLRKALKHKGQELFELDVPLDDLTGADLIEVEQQFFRSGKVSIVLESSKAYLIRVASRAAHIPVEVLEGLSARDFTYVTGQVQVFLTNSDSGTDEECSIPESEATRESGQGTSSEGSQFA